MNLYLKIFIIILFLILLIYLIKKICFSTVNSLNNNYNIKPVSINTNYLTMTEQDFNKLDINKRWYFRSVCLNLFHKIKHNYHYRDFKIPPKSNPNKLIFVNLASYRDPECYKTIQSLIMNSYNWKNLRIVVCEQNSEEDIPYNYLLDPIYNNIINVIKLSYKEARGPTYARYLIQQQYNKEEYYLQIDSHTRFEKFWDLKLINSPEDIFKLDYDRISNLDGWGKQSVSNLKYSIEKAREVTLDRFIFSIGIRHIGIENAKLIADHCNTIDNFLIIINKNNINELLNIDGIGETQIQSITKFAKHRENTAATATKKTLAPYDTRFKPSEICPICIKRLVSSTANLTIR